MCGAGTRSRTRICEGGCSKTSVSDLSETETCDAGVCPGKLPLLQFTRSLLYIFSELSVFDKNFLLPADFH